MKSPLIQIIIKGLATIIVVVGIFYLLITPKLSNMVKNQLEVEKLGYDLKKADDKLSALKEFEKNKEGLDQTKGEVFGLLPDEASASGFILNIESISRQLGVVVDSLSVNEIKATKAPAKTDDNTTAKAAEPAAAAPKAAAEKALSFSANLTADYGKSQSFLKALEMLPRFNTVETLSLTNYSIETGTMNLRTEGKIYYGR